ncbi:MAG: DNA-protecting protein DprA [Confluentimicrobium sp.]|nr:DNA-protecting protein DprA [Actibacterium sp.]
MSGVVQPVDIYSSTHPLAPPTQEEDLVAWLRLIRSRRVGATTFFRLMAEHGSADAALAALPALARSAGVEQYGACPRDDALRELAAGRAAGARLIAFGTPGYPAALADIPDPPPLLWARGRADLLRRPQVALVGARNASSLGTRMTRKLAEGLGAAGMVTVSGLARGVDTAAHLASLDTGTIAVMAGGVDVTYPAENTELAGKIAAQGLLLSEQPIGLNPQARHFPQRNRIISGLARAVIVVEAAARSGSLITAKNALDQGREVLAVPGHPFDARASGCNMLIRDGATLVRGDSDVLEALGAPAEPAAPARPARFPEIPPGPARRVRAAAEIPQLHAEILSRLGPSPLAEDQLIRDLDLPAGAVTPELLTLELDGRITRQAGGLLSRAD